MLTIKINNTALAFYPDTKLRFDINSTLFETDAIPGSYICPFDLPVKGNAIFENAEFIEVMRIYKKYNCVIYLSGYPLFSGELVLNTSQPLKYRCSVILTGISSDFPDRKLNELDYGADILFSELPIYAATQNAVSDDSAECVFPVIHAPNMYGSADEADPSPANADYGQAINSGPKTGKVINNWDVSGSPQFPYNNISINSIYADNAYVMVPQFKLVYIVRKVFESLGYNVSGDFFSDEFITKLLFLNYYALDDKWKNYFISVGASNSETQELGVTGENNAYRISFPDETSTGYEDNDNVWDNTLFEYEVKTAGYITFKGIIHAFPLSWIGGNINVDILLKPTSPPNAQSIWAKVMTGLPEDSFTILIDPEPIYFSQGDVGKKFFFEFRNLGSVFRLYSRKLIVNSSYIELNRFARTIHLANHVTNVSSGNFLNALKNNFGLALWFDAESKTTEIAFAKDILASANYIDITENVIKDSLEITAEESQGYIITQKADDEEKDVSLLPNWGSFVKRSDITTPDKLESIADVLQEGRFYNYLRDDATLEISWQLLCSSILPVAAGNEKNNVNLDFSILPNIIRNDRLIPSSSQLGTSAFFDTGKNDTELQLLIWHGMQDDANAATYPFASALRYAYDGSELSDIELRLDGDAGLFVNYLQPWYDFINTAEHVKLQMKLEHHQLINLLKLFKPQDNKASQQVRKIKYNGCMLLPKAFSFLVNTNGGFVEAEMEALKQGGVDV